MGLRLPHQDHERVTSFNPHQSLLPEPSSNFSAKFPKNALSTSDSNDTAQSSQGSVESLHSAEFPVRTYHNALGARKGHFVLTVSFLCSKSPLLSAITSTGLSGLPSGAAQTPAPEGCEVPSQVKIATFVHSRSKLGKMCPGGSLHIFLPAQTG